MSLYKPVRRGRLSAAAVALALWALLGAAGGGGSASAEAPQAAAQSATTTRFTAARAGEALLLLTAYAPYTDWGVAGRESAVVTVTLDGKFSQDVVLFNGAASYTYRVSLGPVGAGWHTVDAAYNAEKSRPGARGAVVQALAVEVTTPDSVLWQVRRHSPIVYGRNLPEVEGSYENNYTDAPMLMYYTASRDAAGNTTIEYTLIWSNEDGGTDTPALMARWGRTTDVEWVYKVKLDPGARIISETYQAPAHNELPYKGVKLGRHPMLQTSTINNNLSPVLNPAVSSGYRFFLDPSRALPAGRAREVLMDQHPWSYRVMAKEVIRERKIETTPSPRTRAVSDQRNYVYIELDKVTTYPTPPRPGTGVGTAIVVQVKGDPNWYKSHHNVATWSVERDGPAATSVELPPGAGVGDIAYIRALAVPFTYDTTGRYPPPAEYAVQVTRINRAFFLDGSYLPRASFFRWAGSARLTPASRHAVLWRAP
jgi:hypothetical protein